MDAEHNQNRKTKNFVGFVLLEQPVWDKEEFSCCRQSGVLGVYTNGVVYQPQFYLDCSRMMEDGEIPLFNLVWFGLYRGEKGLCGYTMGLENLGYAEMEVLDSAAAPEQLVGFLANVSHYVLSQTGAATASRGSAPAWRC